MNLPNALNTFFGSALIIILIFAECTIKYSSDRILKQIFCTFLAITFLSLVMDFMFSVFNAVPLKHIIKNDIIRACFNFLPLFFALCIVFYLRKMYKNISRFVVLLLGLYLLSLSFDIFIGSPKLIWPVMSALLLFTYLFIILKENKVDTLTGLGNRYSFFEFINGLSRSRTGELWSIAMLDINNFKSINDIYGHLEGDNALRNMAQVIKKCARKSDFVARYGGDEFILMSKADTVINDLIANIEAELDKHNEKSKRMYNIEISYGLDTFTIDGSMQIDDFLSHIDKLMQTHNEEKRRLGDLKA